MTKQKHAVVLRHVKAGGLGTLSGILDELGYGVRYFGPVDEPLDSITFAQADLMIILGGPMGAYQTAEYPFLTDSIQAARDRLAQDRPLLGICLGSQIMATALGSTSYPGRAGKEIGWKPVSLSPTHEEHPLRSFDGAYVLHWHSDTFDLPQGAIRLASSDLYANQAFAYGRNALGLQFHIETDAATLNGWFRKTEDGDSNIVLRAMHEQTTQHEAVLQQVTKGFLTQWLQKTQELP